MTLSLRVGEMPHLSSFGVSLASDAGIPAGGAAAGVGVATLGVAALGVAAGAAESGFLHAAAVSSAAITTSETVFCIDFITAMRG